MSGEPERDKSLGKSSWLSGMETGMEKFEPLVDDLQHQDYLILGEGSLVDDLRRRLSFSKGIQFRRRLPYRLVRNEHFILEGDSLADDLQLRGECPEERR